MKHLTFEKKILFKSGYKHQLCDDYNIDLGIRIDKLIDTDYIKITISGIMTIKKGYAWDGMSGCVKDTKKNSRASLVHDALYQLIRLGKLLVAYKTFSDDLFYQILIEDKNNKIIARFYYTILIFFRKSSILAKNERKEMVAP